MATESAIRAVREMLGPDAAGAGWDSIRIGADLDAGLHPYRIAASWWTFRAASTANLTDVNESGSSRPLRQIHQNAVAQAEMFRGLADKVEAALTPVPPSEIRGMVVHPIRRTAAG